jgi:hypothetical protein
MRRRRQKPNEHTISEPLSVTLRDGTVVTGTLWLHPSHRGSFEVEYRGVRRTDGRTDYSNEGHLKAIARRILYELAGADESTFLE